MLCDKRNVMRELITKIMVSKKILLFRKKFWGAYANSLLSWLSEKGS